MKIAKVIDLTLELCSRAKPQSNPLTTVYIIPRQTLEETCSDYELPCRGFNDNVMIWTSEHVGTHADMPSHVGGKGDTCSTPIERFVGEAVVIDVSFKDPSELATMKIVEKAIREQNVIVKENDIVLFRIWKNRPPRPFSYKPLDEEVANWLVKKKVKLVGVDVPGLDDMSNPRFPVHLALLNAGIPLIENLVNLDKLKGRFLFAGLPLKVQGATGSPIRAVALLE